ncbi:MAG: hypothetical protein K1X57_21115 [Gemmataceae bacterium]|nr:hypothetical protein [Gemmataceae bacterium]
MTRIAAVSMVLLAGAAFAVEPGEVLPGPFSAYIVAGGPKPPASEPVQTEDRQNFADPTRVGKHADLVTRFGLDPTVAVFTRESPADDAPLGKLLKQLDLAVAKNKNNRLRAFGVFLRLKDDFLKDDDRIPQAKAVEALATKAELKLVPLALDQAESARTKSWKLGADDQTTILLYENHRVKAKFTFTADKPLDDAGVQTVLDAVAKLVKR